MNYEDAKVCSSCLEIYGFIYLKSGIFYQKCNSKCPVRDLKETMPITEKEQAKWEGYDYNQVLTLCYCCGAEQLRSGSRWSVWFCETCRKRVLEFNQEIGVSLIPIGRHSLMNGIGLELGPVVSKIKIKETIVNLRQLGTRSDHLERWKKTVKSRNWRSARLDEGQDVGLIKYLLSAKELSKEEAFLGMKDFFLNLSVSSGL